MLVAVTPSIPHRNALRTIPAIPSTVGIPIASSAVTVPRSLHDNRESTADEVRQETLNRAAFEDDRE